MLSTSKKARVKPTDDWVFLPVQAILFVSGLGGALGRALPLHANVAHQNLPVLDATTIGWLGLCVVAVALPKIAELTVGGVSIKLREQAQTVDDDFEEVTASLANLAQNWSTSATLLSQAMTTAPADVIEPKAKVYFDYIRDRMGEAREMLARDPDEALSLQFWLYNSSTDLIEFVNSIPSGNPTKSAYTIGEGMIGKAFAEGRHFNEADVRQVPSYLNTRGGADPPYRAVLCEPALYGRTIVGMVTTASNKVGFFDGYAVDIAKGLGAQCALASVLFREALSRDSNAAS